MALAFTCQQSSFVTTNATSYALGTYTPGARSLLVVFAVHSGTQSAAPTVSGHGLTWSVLTLSAQTLSTTHWIDVYVADSGASPSSAAFTISGFGASQTGAALIEYEITGWDTSKTALQAIVQNPTNTGTGTSGTVTLAAASRSDNRPLACFFHLANQATTPRTNWTEDTTPAASDGNYNTPATGCEAQHRDDAFETTASASWSTSSAWRGVALEILAAETWVPEIRNLSQPSTHYRPDIVPV